jgi:hypothetical protein
MQAFHLLYIPDMCYNAGIPFTVYSCSEISALSVIQYAPVSTLSMPFVMSQSTNLDLAWQIGSLFPNMEKPRTNWAGYMFDVTVAPGDYPMAADIRMLPIMDANPNDRSTIFSILSFVEKQAQLLNMQTACITFDQPLWLKAFEIAMNEKMNVVCRLGGFHTLMNFLGAIGSIMAGSGLAEGLEVCYGPVSVTHMMTGKAYAKALRGHLLTASALSTLLMESITCGQSEIDSMPLDAFLPNEMDELQKYYHSVTDLNCEVDKSLPDAVQKLDNLFNSYTAALATKSRTAKLWLQYIYYVGVAKNFIRAERTNDWHLHLITLSQRLNLFAAAGHRNYAKCGRLYLQMMIDLPDKYPWLFERFSSGRSHSIRRSDRYWAALSTDLIIEQVMMKAVKARGGLTHGRGITESVRNTWVCSMTKCAAVRSALFSLTNLDSSSEETAHVDTGKARLQRDQTDLSRLLTFYRNNNPFHVGEGQLHSIHTGITASTQDGINCDDAEEVGHLAMKPICMIKYFCYLYLCQLRPEYLEL